MVELEEVGERSEREVWAYYTCQTATPATWKHTEGEVYEDVSRIQ